MAKNRSPNYPAVDLEAALELVRPVFKAENRNKFSRLVLAQNLGYSSLNGRALGKIGAVRAYGLIEGSGEDLRLSDDAITALVAPEASQERKEALERCAVKPSLFQELRQQFEGLPSENNLKFWLVKRHFTTDAAAKAAETYLATFRFVGGSSPSYNPNPEFGEERALVPVASEPQPHSPALAATLRRLAAATPRGMLQETFNLKEGPVTLSFPASLSMESYDDLSDQLELILRRAKRRVAPKDESHEDH